ncbi:uncharacterized protein [Taeniopygia guttata]|uniref:uncharacterized protein n=1 Tax=Taeniopygia guttata TaxID=59729 RepID=UPI003BB984F0
MAAARAAKARSQRSRAEGERRRSRAAPPFPAPAQPSQDAGSGRVPKNPAGAACGRRSGALALPAPAAALLGRSSEPSPSRRVPGSSRRVPAASPCFSAVSTLAQAPRLPVPVRCMEMQENTEASGRNRRWRCPSRLLARRSIGARRRELTGPCWILGEGSLLVAVSSVGREL